MFDEGNEGKNLEKERKEEFEKKVLEQIETIKEEGEIIINNWTLKVYKNEEKFLIKLGKDELCSIDEKTRSFTYDIDNLKEIQNRDQNNKELTCAYAMKEMGFPNVEYLEYLKEKENREREDNSETEGDDKKTEEKGENEEQKGPEETEEIKNSITLDEAIQKRAKELGKSPRELKDGMYGIELDRNKVAGDKTLREVLNITHSKMYAIQIDENTWSLEGLNEKGELVQIAEQQENPSTRRRVSLEEENKLEESPFLAEFRIKGADENSKIAIQREGEGSASHIQILYGREQEERGLNEEERTTYVTVAREDGYDRKQEEAYIRDYMGRTETSDKEFAKKNEERKILLEDAEVPGVEKWEVVDEIEPRKNFIEKEIKRLEEKGLNMPGQAEFLAEKIADKVLIERVPFDEAEQEVLHGNKQEKGNGQKTPGENPRKRGN